jgi:hypothetical protein
VSRGALYEAALCAAFWVALLGFAQAPRGRGDALRFVAGLALGAALAHAGGLLWLPLGLVLAAPWRASARARFLDAALPALPAACVTAKLGCAAAACCAAPLAEALGFAAVAVASRRFGGAGWAGALALAGLGAVRLAALPLRPEALGSAPLALLWLAAGALWCAAGALRCRTSHGDPACPRPGSATSSRTPRSSRAGCAASSAAPAT